LFTPQQLPTRHANPLEQPAPSGHDVSLTQSSFWKQKLFPLESFPQAQLPRGPLHEYLVYVPHVLASHGSDDVAVGVGGVVMVEFVVEVVKKVEAVEVWESVVEETVVDALDACLSKM